MLVWGIFTFIVYLGVPVHGLVYLTDAQNQAVNAACTGDPATIGTQFCRGMELIFPFLGRLVATSRPIWGYIVISLLAYGVFLMGRAFKTGRFVIETVITPLHLIGGFILSVWLFGTVLSFGSLMRGDGADRTPFRQFYEPTQAVYSGVGPEALKELQENYQSLLERGCLSEFAMTNNGAKVYHLSPLCIQQAMFVRIGAQIFLLAVLLLNFLVAGRLFLKLINRKQAALSPLLEFVFSMGLGSFAWVVLLWLLAALGLLRGSIELAFFFGIPLLAFKETFYWLKSSVNRKISVDESTGHIMWLLVWLLISYLALNFLNVIRPFPIGWDDLGSYLNRPRLLASYGSFIPSMPTFQWEYLAAMAYSLFGIDSIIGSTFAMIINWSAGLLSVIAAYAFGRVFFGPKGGILAAILYYFLPMTGHFSFADMKIDNASFFTSALSALAIFVYLFGAPGLESEHSPKGKKSLLLLAGLIAGFSFAIKPTGVLMILLLSSVLAGSTLGVWGFLTVTAASFVVMAKFTPFSIVEIAAKIGIPLTADPALVRTVTIGVFAAIALLFCALTLRHHRMQWKSVTMSILLFGAGMALSAAPWMAHNAWSHGYLQVSSLLSYKNTLSPYMSFLQKEDVPPHLGLPENKIHYLPPELKLNPEDPACKTSAKVEELDRYWGFGTGWSHYLTLPWRAVMNSDAVGYYVTLMPGLLLLPLLLLLPYFWIKEGRWLRFLFAGSIVFLIQWMFVANGVMWYGLGMFLGFSLALEALVRRAPDPPNRILASTLIGLSILICLMNRMWQFDVQKNLFEYPLGKVSASGIREVTIPLYDNIRDSVVSRHESMNDRPYTYRIGTFISYFIPKNAEIFPLADHQLQFFNCMNQERNHALTLKRLQALGFNSIIFDTNTATIEKDPNGSLHKKVQAFLDFANDPTTGVKPVYSEPELGIAYMLLP